MNKSSNNRTNYPKIFATLLVIMTAATLRADFPKPGQTNNQAQSNQTNSMPTATQQGTQGAGQTATVGSNGQVNAAPVSPFVAPTGSSSPTLPSIYQNKNQQGVDNTQTINSIINILFKNDGKSFGTRLFQALATLGLAKVVGPDLSMSYGTTNYDLSQVFTGGGVQQQEKVICAKWNGCDPATGLPIPGWQGPSSVPNIPSQTGQQNFDPNKTQNPSFNPNDTHRSQKTYKPVDTNKVFLGK